MAWKLSYSAKSKLILLRYSGRIPLEEYDISAERAHRLAAAHDCARALVDVRHIEQVLQPIEISRFPLIFRCIGVPTFHKIAILVSKGKADSGSFHYYETVCQNHGYVVQLFQAVAPAKQWLRIR
jgi:hypothetical protein